MNLVQGYPFWLIKDGLPFDYPCLENSLATDVAIIGGGISGALMAYHLCNAGIACIVVDGRTIGLGSTCASTSLLQYEIDTPLAVLKDKIGLKNAVTAYKLCEESIGKLEAIDKKINCGEFENKQSLYYASSKKHLNLLKKEFEVRKENGFKVSYLPADAIKEQYGFDAHGAILSSTGAQTNAYKFTHELLQFCQNKGVQIYDRTNIVDIKNQNDDVVLTANNGFKITAKKLVYANGYEAVNYIKKKIVSLRTTYATISEQYSTDVKFWKDEVLIWNTDDPYLYLRTTKDRRIITGGRDDVFKKNPDSNHVIQRIASALKKDFENLFPQIDYTPEFNWAGTFGSTKDGLPFIGSYKEKPNSYFALGYGGNGITFSLIAAEMITDLIKNNRTKNRDLFSFERV